MNTAMKNVKMKVPMNDFNMYLYSFFKMSYLICKYNILPRCFVTFIFF
jgi:hypothetical protein